MRSDLHITPALITRRYDQGLDSIIRLVTDLTDRIEDLSALHVGKPQRTIRAQQAEIKRLKQTIENKDAALTQAHQLNQPKLQTRIRELEKTLEVNPQLEVVTGRDSHNSNQPPSLLPWKKPKRTRSLRKQSGLKVGGQLGHHGVTLHQVAEPNRVIIHQADECRQCGTSLVAASANNFHKRQVFEIEDGAPSVVEHRASMKSCPACGNISRGQFPTAVKAPVQYGVSILSRALYLPASASRPNAGSDARFIRLRHFAGFDPARSSDASKGSKRRFVIQM